jgi:hypothetical protein
MGLVLGFAPYARGACTPYGEEATPRGEGATPYGEEPTPHGEEHTPYGEEPHLMVRSHTSW